MSSGDEPDRSMSTRVLHVLPHKGGGAETYIDLLERLPGLEHQRFYLSAGRSPASALISVPWRWPRLAAQAARADVIHSHGDVASAIALPLLRRRPAVMTCQGLHMLRRASGIRQQFMVRAVTQVARACQGVICSSIDERDELADLLPESDHHKLQVILNGVDPAPRVDERTRNSVRAELGLPQGVVLGIFVGQLEQRKAPLLAARAAIQVRRQGAPFVLAFVGEGPQANQLRALAGDAVRVLGHRSDVSQLMAAADVFVHPSEREGMSFALLEAMSHGLAAVAADSSSNPEAVGDAGLLFKPGDEASLCQALLKTAEPRLRASLGEKAGARTNELFGPADFLARSNAAYLRVLEFSRRGVRRPQTGRGGSGRHMFLICRR